MPVTDRYSEYWTLQLIPLSSPKASGNSPGKRPVASGWPKIPEKRRAQGVSPDTVAREIDIHLDRGGNIGLACPEGAIILDADTEDAVSFLDSYAVEHGCPKQKTAKGAHYVWRCPDGFEYRNTTKISAGGALIDVRGYGAQIVVAPSVHATGIEYVWEIPLPASIDDLPLLPDDLAKAVKRGRGKAETRALPAAPSPARPSSNGAERPPQEGNQWDSYWQQRYIEGERHAAATSLAGHYVATTSPSDARAIMRRWNELQCSPALPDKELDEILSWCIGKEAAQRRAPKRTHAEREQTLGSVAERVGVPVESVVWYGGDTPTYQLSVTVEGEGGVSIMLTAHELVNQSAFRAAVLAHTRQLPRLHPRNRWDETVQALASAAVIIPLGFGATEADVVRLAVESYLAQNNPVEADNPPSSGSWIADGSVWFAAEDVLMESKYMLGGTSLKRLCAQFNKLGFTPKRVKFSHEGEQMRRRVWGWTVVDWQS